MGIDQGCDRQGPHAGELMLIQNPEAALLDGDPGADIPLLDGEGPLWLQIRRSFASAILTGRWPAGMKVPPELALSRHYASSRMTVTKAIQSLAAAGLVERRPKIGTVVTGQARERPVLEIWDAADAVRREGHRYGYRLIECGMLPKGATEREALTVTDRTPVLRMICLHLADEKPFQLEERLINVDAAPSITCQPLEEVSPGRWLLANVPWTEARHTIAAQAAPVAIASELALPVGAPCLVLERQMWNDGSPVTFGRFWYPGESHRLEARFQPTW